jgi:lon-related putative ATP-dependent protease
VPVCPIRALPPEALCQRCDPATLSFETTAATPRIEDFVGQDEAIEAVHFGIAVRHDGYNLFVVGPPGVGKQSVLQQLLARKAAEDPPSVDWCYIHNFEDEHRPRALALPAGKGALLRADLERTVAELQAAVRAAFEGEEYRTRRQKLVRELEDRQDKAFRSIESQAREVGVGVLRERDLFSVSPWRDGKVMPPAEFEALPEAEQARLKTALARSEDALGVMLQEFNDWGRQHREALEALQRGTAAAAGARLFADLQRRYVDEPRVLEYLAELEADLADSADEFIEEEGSAGDEGSSRRGPPLEASSSFELRATVNVLIGQPADPGAPVVYEHHPTYANLMGRIEHTSQFGSLTADFTLIQPGALHRALGGYLLLDAGRVLENPEAWHALQRTLRSHEINLESSGQQADGMPMLSLRPEPIPFTDTKVILLGDHELYETLAEQDPDFLELFKILVDFEDRMDRTPETEVRYANLLAWLALKDGLHDFTCGGVARVIDHACRLAEDSGKISVCMRPILDLMREADCHAELANASLVTADHVQEAIGKQRQRAGRLRARMLEDVRHGVTIIDTAGLRVGQVNGLVVVRSGEQMFGQTVRISARVWVGKGDVVDIERDVELGGPLHSKGVLISRGLLGARYATERPLSFSASLVFEQSYGSVEGDSASLAEACALLSALADLPVLQSIAVTGSMNQHGEVQAIGGVNEKIEGFFDVCGERGLSGAQGVAIPSSNVRHLMLNDQVVAAVRAGRFHIWAVDTLDEAISLLIGREAGERDARGSYPEGTINRAVEDRLHRFTEHCARSERLRLE